ncbi:MAG: hypothetical protein Q9162_007455 [Coniocarpon cinnabarinum]
MEVYRQNSMRQLAAQADQRWKQQESFLDKPEETGQAQPLMQPLDKGAYNGGASKPGAPSASDASLNVTNTADEVQQKTRGTQSAQDDASGDSPQPSQKQNKLRKKFEDGRGDGWQPGSWSPGKLEKR